MTPIVTMMSVGCSVRHLKTSMRFVMVNVFQADGIPYVGNPQVYSNSGVFDTKVSSVMSRANSIVIDVDLEFITSDLWVWTYVPAYRYITPRSVILNRSDIQVSKCQPLPHRPQRHTVDEIVFVSKQMSKTNLFDHKFMNFLNFMDVDYERLCVDRKGPHYGNQIRAIFAAKGQNFGMTQVLYDMIASHYNKTYEAFGTQWNHFLPNHGDILKDSFFDSKHEAYDCIIANPPFTENIMKITLAHSVKMLRRKQPLTIYVFYPLWVDCLSWIKLANCRVFALKGNPVYDFENKRHYSVDVMLVVLSNNYGHKERDVFRSIGVVQI